MLRRERIIWFYTRDSLMLTVIITVLSSWRSKSCETLVEIWSYGTAMRVSRGSEASSMTHVRSISQLFLCTAHLPPRNRSMDRYCGGRGQRWNGKRVDLC